jgi:hypothetical protein
VVDETAPNRTDIRVTASVLKQMMRASSALADVDEGRLPMRDELCLDVRVTGLNQAELRIEIEVREVARSKRQRASRTSSPGSAKAWVAMPL